MVRQLGVGFGFLAVDLHLHLALLGPQHHRLLPQSPNHVERVLRLAPQGQFLHVLGDAPLDHSTQLLGDGEEAVRRAQSFEGLVRSLVIVVLHPPPHPLAGLLEAVELRPYQEVFPDRFPKPLDLAQCHRVMRLALDVVDVILAQLLFEAGLAMPRRVLPPVVSKHLLGQPVLGHGRAIHLQNMLRRLAAKQIEPDNIARVVVDETDEVGILPTQPKREDVALPHLIGRVALKETGLGWIAFRFGLGPVHEVLLVQRAPHRLVTARQPQHPPQHLRDALDPKVGILLFQRRDPRLDQRCHLGSTQTTTANQRPQTCFALFAIAPNPRRQGAQADPGFLGHKLQREPFFQPQLHGFQPQFHRPRLTTAPRQPPRGLGFLLPLP